MTERNPFATQSRQQVVKSTANSSQSKQLWTFPKRRRFQLAKPECPHAFYQQNFSALSNIQIKFPSSERKLFSENAHSPSPAQYFTQKEKSSKGNSFGLSRNKCRFRSYIETEPCSNPGPSDYDKFAGESAEKAKKGYTMRPKTATDRNYFIENKELQQVPGPSNYECEINKKGESKVAVAKFRSVTLGGVGLMKKSKRFESSLTKTPGPSQYQPKKTTKNSSIGFRMGNTSRTSFIDEATNQKTPGPADYLLPSQFGHYKKPEIRSRLATIQ